MAIPETLRPLFPDVAFEKLDWKEHRNLIIRRVLEAGTLEMVAWLRAQVSDAELAEWITARHGAGLLPQKLRYWQLALKLDSRSVDEWVRGRRSHLWEM